MSEIKISYKVEGTIMTIAGDTVEEFLAVHSDPRLQEFISMRFPEGATKSNDAPFEVEFVKLASGGEHPRWVAQGGNFMKFGVTLWPETLEAVGLLDALNPLDVNVLPGKWLARYNLREDGKPDKVVELIPVDDVALRQVPQEAPVAKIGDGVAPKIERKWTSLQLETLVHNKLAKNGFAAKGMLDLSVLPETATVGMVFDWGTMYRDYRKNAVAEVAAGRANELWIKTQKESK